MSKMLLLVSWFYKILQLTALPRIDDVITTQKVSGTQAIYTRSTGAESFW